MTPRPTIAFALLLAFAASAPAQTTRPTVELDGSQIQRTELARRSEMAIRRGVKFLLSRQNPDGSWESGGSDGQTAGMTALVTLSLLSCGESHTSPPLQLAIKYLKASTPDKSPWATYSVALRACVYAELPEAMRDQELRADLRWLERNLLTRGEAHGMYDYAPERVRGGDFSNSQYGVLGVWYAAQAGLEVPKTYWKQVEDAWLDAQESDGGWPYRPFEGRGPRRLRSSYASMTAAGAATLFITNDYLHAGNASDLTKVSPNAPLENAIKWLGVNFAADHNPGRDSDLGPQRRIDQDMLDIMGEVGRNTGYYVHYMLFGFERVGEASGLTRFGAHKWFDEGADFLIRTQAYDGSWTGSVGSEGDTAYSLLFLSRGRSPVVVQKLQFDGRWNNRPRDVSGFTQFMRRAGERHVNWQAVSINGTPAEFRESPMLYVASDRPLNFNPTQQQRIKDYIDQGGLLICVNEGTGDDMAKSVVAMAKRLYPGYEFRDLPLNHLAYTANFPVTSPDDRIRGLSNGVRELMVLYPTGDMSWRWHSTGGGFLPRNSPYASLANLSLYVTDRANPRFKGEETWVERNPGVKPQRTLRMARVPYEGNWNPEPGGWTRLANLMWNLDQFDLRVETSAAISLTVPNPGAFGSKTANAYGLAHLTATRTLLLPPELKMSIQDYTKAGGLLLIDAAGGSDEAAGSFEPELKSIWPNLRLDPLPLDHPIYHGQNYGGQEITEAHYRRTGDPNPVNIPRLRAATVDGKLVAIVSFEDISAALVGYSTAGVHGYTPASASDLVRNIILWRAGGR